jgi:type IV secretion system protein VirB9
MKPKYITLLLSAFVAVPPLMWAQQEGSLLPPVQVKRIPATPQSGSDAVPTLQQYPFAQAIGVLENEPSSGNSSSSPLPKSAPKSTRGASGVRSKEVPKDFVVKGDVPLTPTATDAVAVSKQWQNAHATPAPGQDGRVLYTFGAGMPVVVCSPLHICVLELQAGEHLLGEPHIGDSVRWDVAPAQSGSADLATPLIVVKPLAAGLDTTMVVPTDRRAYYVRLQSKPEEYVARVAFTYPDDHGDQWKQYMEKQKEAERDTHESSRVAYVPAIDQLFFNYKIKGGDPIMRPVRVLDDGAKTYLQMNPLADHRELPVLVVKGPAGSEMVNYRVRGDMYIVDRLFDHAALLVGSGKHQKKVEITREAPLSQPSPILAQKDEPEAGR